MDNKIMERLISFDSKADLEKDLAAHIAEILSECIATTGFATMLLSGGSTPKQLYEQLGNFDLDWSKVHIGLVDERFVHQTNVSSNEKLIRETLMIGRASNASFHSLVFDSENYDENLKMATEANRIFENTDVILLGMGDDGHTASLFPNDSFSTEATTSTNLLANTTAPNEPSKRITFCGPILQQGKHVFLMITGSKKLEVLAKCQEENYPIQHFIPFIKGIYYTENV